ncbi:CHAD domain-containing protein [Rathayibacter sp. VKM Ac-2803]|uniref:CYTH and CHAD domain-containing protein n=1 Tax=Rathayibacter sp. VKM Ac-2803 TaxID=2609256 RepID=UPI00135BB0D5|nr:CYTH and CHAD domain-containing protein [Rathayibacter sp. VKM Ac-2803]MWV50336.1 CHAD domain-containing protein [Rathayibacter sp. VKM Ac-2803]
MASDPAKKTSPSRSVQTEVERKYDVDAEAELPELVGAGAVASIVREEPVTLRAEYFDTADRALSRGRITLRRRVGGADEGWHVKLPGSAGRTEIHAPLTSTSTVPAAVREPVLAHVARARLEPLAVLETVRGITRAADGEGRLLAEIADDLVIALDVRSGQERRWREWEVELVDVHGAEGEAALDAIEARLLEAGARPAASASKLARATGGPIDESSATPGDGGEAALAAIRALLRDLRSIDPHVRLETDDALHRMRVLTRRLRTVLAGSRSVLERASTDPLRDELRWLAAVLGAARDEEVLADRLRTAIDAAADESPGLSSAYDTLFDAGERRHATALSRVSRTLRGGRYLALLASIDALLADPPLTERAGSSAKKLLDRSVEKELARLERASSAPAEEAETARHEIRKAAKRLRYLVQAWTSVVPSVVKKRHRALESAAERVADALGEERDAAALRETVRAWAVSAEKRGEPAFLLGVVFADQAQRAREAGAAGDAALARLHSLSR